MQKMTKPTASTIWRGLLSSWAILYYDNTICKCFYLCSLPLLSVCEPGIQCDIARPLPFLSSTHFSHYQRLLIWMLLTHLPRVSTWQLKAESFWKDIWSCGFTLWRSLCLHLSHSSRPLLGEVDRGEGWKEMGILKLLGPSVPDFPVYVT